MAESVAFSPTDLDAYFAFRADLLGPAQSRILTGAELMAASHLLYGHLEGLSVYGVPAPQMAERGLRLSGRTVIECTVDAHCTVFTDGLSACLGGEPELSPGFVADLFCGSGNLGWHLGARLGLPVFATELGQPVYAATRHNLQVMGIDIDLRHADYRDLLGRLPSPRPGDIYVVAPPWGPALTERGLALDATSPPVPEILAAIQDSRAGRPCLVATQAMVVNSHDQVTYESLARCFRNARHLVSVTQPLPGEAELSFHVHALPG